MKKLAIFASGKGSNAEKIIQRSREHVALIVSNVAGAGVVEIAKKYNIPFLIIDRKMFADEGRMLNELKKFNIDFIVLAGFLWMIPEYFLKHFHNRIINLHPALLPKYGGKGMYGMNVHKAVLEAGEKESGITIHYINERYDEGEIIFQAKCEIEPGESPETLAQKIHFLEHKYFPMIVERLITT